MKKISYLSLFVACIALFSLSSCEPLGQTVFEKNMLIGRWSRPSTLTKGQECWRYDADFTGVTWDTGDDVTESEGQPFTWELDKDNLLQVHLGKMGQKVPKNYTMKELTPSKMVYFDVAGNQFFSFSKMQ